VRGKRSPLVDHADHRFLDQDNLNNIVASASNSTLSKTVLPAGFGAFENGPKNQS
jgi:hypothetical protein